MPAQRKASIRQLSASAYEMGLSVVQGRLRRDVNGGWTLDGRQVDEWLAEYEGQDLVVIVASMDDDRPMPGKTCRTCGTEYVGIECPHCREARRRLRGR
ncbi:MAG: hypothetical protein GX620_12155 [Chloroflexi bacterium]|nr:hypothetical protein [Chloroflexota bacterium]